MSLLPTLPKRAAMGIPIKPTLTLAGTCGSEDGSPDAGIFREISFAWVVDKHLFLNGEPLSQDFVHSIQHINIINKKYETKYLHWLKHWNVISWNRNIETFKIVYYNLFLFSKHYFVMKVI